RALKKLPAEQAVTIGVAAAHAALDALRRAGFADTLAADDELGIAQMTTRLLTWEQQLDKRAAKKDAATDDEAIVESTREIERARQSIAATDAESQLAPFVDASATEPNLAFGKAALRLWAAWGAGQATQSAALAGARG